MKNLAGFFAASLVSKFPKNHQDLVGIDFSVLLL